MSFSNAFQYALIAEWKYSPCICYVGFLWIMSKSKWMKFPCKNSVETFCFFGIGVLWKKLLVLEACHKTVDFHVSKEVLSQGTFSKSKWLSFSNAFQFDMSVYKWQTNIVVFELHWLLWKDPSLITFSWPTSVWSRFQSYIREEVYVFWEHFRFFVQHGVSIEASFSLRIAI